MTKENNNTMAKAGMGIAALAAAAAGMAYFYGKGGAKHRKALKGWMVKAQGEVLERVESMKDISQIAYDKTVNEVMDKYKKIKTVSPQELATLGAELKGHWNTISREVSKMGKPTVKRKPAGKKKK